MRGVSHYWPVRASHERALDEFPRPADERSPSHIRGALQASEEALATAGRLSGPPVDSREARPREQPLAGDEERAPVCALPGRR